jgi:hypothetical protein
MTEPDPTPTQRRVLICGDRNWSDRRMVRNFVNDLEPNTIVITGMASGADTDAWICAGDRELQVLEFPAKWKEYGRAAGPIRNRQMLDEGRPTEVHAFHDNLLRSKGTANMLKLALKRGLRCYLHSHFVDNVYKAFGGVEEVTEVL